MSDSDFYSLPEGLPVPEDDGACDHLTGMVIPSLALPSTAGGTVDFAQARRLLVLYCYPLTGRPGTDLPAGWDDIPGARGCTPQTCAFRDHAREIANLGADVFGMSTQATDYQSEMVERLDVPFPVLSDGRSCHGAGPRPADVRRRGNDTDQAPDAYRRKGCNREGFLSCVSAAREPGPGRRLADGASRIKLWRHFRGAAWRTR